jgi:hypothetical protein
MTGSPDRLDTRLARWQAGIGDALLTSTIPAVPVDSSSSDPSTPAQRSGWAVTVALYRQWRIFRLRSVAPLTLALLAERADVIVDAYLAAHPGSSSYAAVDGEGFLRFAAAALPDDPYLMEITFLERAFIAVSRPAEMEVPPPRGLLRRSRRACLGSVPFDPHDLLLWLAGRGCRPDIGRTRVGVPVLVAPYLPAWVRVATAAEVRLWDELATDQAADAVPDQCRAAVSTLRAAGAVLG